MIRMKLIKERIKLINKLSSYVYWRDGRSACRSWSRSTRRGCSPAKFWSSPGWTPCVPYHKTPPSSSSLMHVNGWSWVLGVVKQRVVLVVSGRFSSFNALVYCHDCVVGFLSGCGWFLVVCEWVTVLVCLFVLCFLACLFVWLLGCIEKWKEKGRVTVKWVRLCFFEFPFCT